MGTPAFHETYHDVLALFAEYEDIIDSGRFQEWPELFVADANYKVVPRENFERNLPIALLWCESQAAMKDRVYAITQSQMVEPRNYRHFGSSVRLMGEADGVISVKSSVLLVQTMLEQMTEIVLAGFFLDKLVRVDGKLKFKERICVTDTLLIPTSLVIPV